MGQSDRRHPHCIADGGRPKRLARTGVKCSQDGRGLVLGRHHRLRLTCFTAGLITLLLLPYPTRSEPLHDLNCDGRVDLADFRVLLDAYQKPAVAPTHLVVRLQDSTGTESPTRLSVTLAPGRPVTTNTDTSGVAHIDLSGVPVPFLIVPQTLTAERGDQVAAWNIQILAGTTTILDLSWESEPVVIGRESGHRAPIDRVFVRADQWARNGTLDQLDGFDTVRLSSYVVPSVLEEAANAGKHLMIGLSPPHAPTDAEYAGDILEQGSDGPLDRFTAWLDSLRWIHNIQIDAMMYNLEVRYALNAHHGNIDAVSGAYADLIHRYRSIYRSRYPAGDFWVYSGPGPNLWSKIHYSADWDRLTRGPNAIDACYIGGPLTSDHTQAVLSDIQRHVTETASIVNGKPIVWQVMTHGAAQTESRNGYHKNWNGFREAVSEVRRITEEASGRRVPITYYPQHYVAGIVVDGSPVTVDFTLDGYGTAPDKDVPWQDLGAYPARLWLDDRVGQWWDGTANRWEAEFVSNFLVGAGYPATPITIDQDEVCDGLVILPGDVVVRGATLEIRPGAEIRFREGSDLFESGRDVEKAELIVEFGGILNAIGTESEPIVFRSTNLNDPTDEDWYGIREDGGAARLEYVVLRDALANRAGKQ